MKRRLCSYDVAAVSDCAFVLKNTGERYTSATCGTFASVKFYLQLGQALRRAVLGYLPVEHASSGRVSRRRDRPGSSLATDKAVT